MKLFNRIIAILLIISLQACGVGTQSLLGNLGSKPNTSGPAVGPALSQSIEPVSYTHLTLPTKA